MWPALALAALGCYGLKLLGLSVPQRVLENRFMQSIAAVLPIALLAALAVTQTFSQGRHLTIDARAAGIAVAIVAIRMRAPFLVTVGAAAATTALIRLAF